IFFFDGSIGVVYTPEQLARIGLFSAPFPAYSKWNGLGRLTDADLKKVTHVVDSVHSLGKKIRFWAAPDTKTTWYEWVKLGIDYINTDKPEEVSAFMRNYAKTTYTEEVPHLVYQPEQKTAIGQHPKNIILLISDGAGISQLWAAAVANRGQLNVLNMPYTGYLVTSSTDNYHTDSAAGGSALATGVKTRNRYIGVDTSGNAISNIPDEIAKVGMVSGIVSNDRITGATPSAFYAHVSERNHTDSIAAQLVDSKLSLMVGGFHKVFAEADSALIKKLHANGVTIMDDAESIAHAKGDRLLVFAQ